MHVCVSVSSANYWMQTITWFRHGHSQERMKHLSGGAYMLTTFRLSSSLCSFRNDEFKNWINLSLSNWSDGLQLLLLTIQTLDCQGNISHAYRWVMYSGPKNIWTLKKEWHCIRLKKISDQVVSLELFSEIAFLVFLLWKCVFSPPQV